MKLLIKFYFVSPIIFQNINALVSMVSWSKRIILGAYCDMCLYMLYISIYVFTYVGYMLLLENFVNIDIIGFNASSCNLSCTK